MSTAPLAAADRYFNDAMARLPGLLANQRDALDRAASLCTDAIAADGLVHLFGVGHSRMMCEEMTPRQGCYVGWHTIVELGLTYHNVIVGPNGLRQSLHLEKTLGYAEQILRNFAFGPKDVLIVVSTSGIREIIIEMAAGAKERGLSVIALLSKAHCEQSKPAHPSGKKLIDIADVVLDNGAPIGDSLLDILPSPSGRGAGGEGGSAQTPDASALTPDPSPRRRGEQEALTTDPSPRRRGGKTGPFSTLGGAMVMNMLRCEVAQRLLDRGIEPVFLPSHQFVGSRSVEEQLEYFYAQYARRVAPLFARQG